MGQGSIVLPRPIVTDPAKQEKVDPLMRLCYIPTYIGWSSLVLLALSRYTWPRAWLVSGAPILTFCLLLGASKGHRILPFIHLWTVLVTLHLVYSISATSWLLHGLFAATCWPAILLTCLFQFETAANIARRRLRALLRQLHFLNDKVAFFNIPALEIDTEVSGLFVIRGLTFSLSALTLEVHGVEVGIKLTDDMELAIQCELVKVLFFRRIEVGDCYANLKGGEFEMTFGKLDERTEDADGNPLMNTDTPLLRAAAQRPDGTTPLPTPGEKVRMTEYMTAGHEPTDVSPQTGIRSMTQLSPDDENAAQQFHEALAQIKRSSRVEKLRRKLQDVGNESYKATDKNFRAAICSHLHDTPSVPHPPQQSIRVTTLKNMSSPGAKHFLHRLPLLLRLLLNPLSYFHPVSIASVTATASGAWIRYLLLDKVFGDHADHDRELRKIRKRMLLWLADANFAFEMDNISGLATVPVVTEYNINCFLAIKDILVYRTLPAQVDLKEVVRLGGADATFSVPTFLLPHHEHLLPPVPSTADKQEIMEEIEHADGKPQAVQAQQELSQAEKDETNVQMSIHAKLPACFDQTVLDFAAALVKATKLVEMDKSDEIMSDSDSETSSLHHSQSRGVKDFFSNINSATKEGLKKAVVSGVVNDRWIAKLVGKVIKMLETAQGDVGYSGNIPVPLKPYRDAATGEGTKLLP